MLSGPQVVVQPASRPGSRMNFAAGGAGPGGDALVLQQQGGPSSEMSEATNMAAGDEERGPAGGGVRGAHADSEDDLDDDEARPRTVLGGGGGGGGYWGSRPPSPGGGADNLSESSSNMPPHAGHHHHHHHHHNRRKSVTGGAPMMAAAASGPMADPNGHKFNNLNYWKARKVTFYKNGDPYFPGVEFRFKPGRDVRSMEALQDKLSLRMDLPRGARFIFTMDGTRINALEELDDGGNYVVSSYKTFKNASYGKKPPGVWYPPSNTAPQGGWGGPRPGAVSRKASLADADLPPPGGGGVPPKTSSGRVIRIINNLDHTVQCRVLLNLRTSQPFEEVLEDLGQVLKMNGAKRMYTIAGQEVRSFSQLRNEFSDVDTFYLGPGASGLASPPARRSRSRGPAVPAAPVLVEGIGHEVPKRRSRSKSRPRNLYAADPQESVRANDFSLLEIMKEEPIRVTIRGMRRTLFPPLHHAPFDNSPPEKRLQLDWVYGYRGHDTKRNLWVLPTGELLYYVGAVAVLYDRDEESQRHYTGHTEDIQCMDVHPSREMVASGQRGGRNRKTQAHIRIWSTETLLTLYLFGMGEFEVGVTAVAYSQMNGGSYVLAVDGGRERILSVWQWQWGHLLGKVATMQEDMTGASFHPLDDNLLITHGKGHLTFWTRRKDGFFERTDIVKPMGVHFQQLILKIDSESSPIRPSRTNVTCLQFESDGDVITADSDGFVTIYSVDSDGSYFVRMEFEAHNKAVTSMVMLSEGTLLTGGERDRRIVAWDSLQNYKKITDTKLPEVFGGVRSIYPQRPGRNDGNIYVGTIKNQIVEGSLQRRFNQVVFGHHKQLLGLAVHPDDDLFASAGHDKVIAMWRKHKLIWSTQVAYECTSLAFHPFGVVLSVGTADGHLIVLNSESGAMVATVRVCGSILSSQNFAPAGDMLAIGSHNGSIYLFRVSRDGFSYKKSNKIRGTQPIAQLDFSTDGFYLQVQTGDYDLVFWDIRNLSVEKSPITMKDTKWYSQTCTLGYLIAGIWNNRYYPSTSMISTVNRSAAHDLMIVGDTEGYLRFFRHPCVSAKAEYHEEKVYSMQISCARFLFNDRNVVTAGGSDATLMLWDIVDD